jgi:hypothetical protein
VGVEWFVGGGFPMLFIALFGAIALAQAVRFAVQPLPGRVGPVAAYAAAVGFAAIAGVCVDLSMVGRTVAGAEDLAPADMARWVLMGVSESMAPAILGFAFLAVIALAVAVGLRRTPAAPPAGG